MRLAAPWTVVKVGDTASDIKEGLQAGTWSVGVVIGSSQMGLSQSEFESLSGVEKTRFITNAEQSFFDYGADFTIKTMQELPELIDRINAFIRQGKRPCPLKRNYPISET